MRRSNELQQTDDIYMRLQVAKQNELDKRAQGDMMCNLYLIN